MQVRFLKDHKFSPNGKTVHNCKAGDELAVPDAKAERLVELEIAEEVTADAKPKPKAKPKGKPKAKPKAAPEDKGKKPAEDK